MIEGGRLARLAMLTLPGSLGGEEAGYQNIIPAEMQLPSQATLIRTDHIDKYLRSICNHICML